MNQIHPTRRHPPREPLRKLPPLHALRAFEAAARHLHFTHAADELGLTPTAISHQVRQLEEMLGADLFQRYPRPIRLTDKGAQLYPVLQDALDRIAVAIAGLADHDTEPPLRLSVTVAFASRWLMPRLATLRRQTGLFIAVEANDEPADLRLSGVDIAIRYAEKPAGDAEWHRLLPDRIIPVAAPGIARQDAPLSPASILALPLLHYRWRSGAANAPSWPYWKSLAGVAGADPPIEQSFSEEIHAIDAAAAGHGAVLASEVLVADLLRKGELVRLSDIALPAPSYWVVFLPSHPAQKRLAMLLDWIRQQA
ncbi:LysR substrate-binding domain-containing protein [Paracoccus pacificus]|uniref:LysR substrate-binding domain-containing protein n=1 Tax=Paracoccus pacificus TaxID=1463598 RepID=A0ABW4R5G2_9RHOB